MSAPQFVRDDYADFCDGVGRLTGIDLAQYRRIQMERRVRAFAGRRGITSLSEYLTALGADEVALEEFRDRMTINVSQLWRNPEQWAHLAKTIVPELLGAGSIRAWSAGCSYGAEAYTLAAVCRDASPGLAVEIRGTDIDPRMITRARDGRFSPVDVRTAPRAALDRWFDRAAAGWRAKPELRMMTRFDTADLLSNPAPAATFDLILCRNVVIYFTESVRDRLHGLMAAALRPGGHLMVGSSERIATPEAFGLENSHRCMYRKA